MMLSLDTAYRSFGGEVEASSTPTICRLSDSRRHQLRAIARLTVYVPVREGTVASIKYIVLCCGMVACEAQKSRSCEARTCKGHHDPAGHHITAASSRSV